MTDTKDLKGYTTAEIKGIYNITDAAVRMAIKRGSLTEGIDCIKIGNSWLIYEHVAERLWGDKK